MARRRVPEKDHDFSYYLQNTTKVLETGSPNGAIRLGLSSAEFDQWKDYRDEWLDIYPQYTNLAKRTTTITNQKNHLKKEFTLFAKKPLDKISGSENLTTGDRATFNLPERDRTLTRRGAIIDIPMGEVKGTGGGGLKIRTRRETEAGRCAKHKLADAIEFKYIIYDSMPEDFFTNPPTPDDCPNNILSKKAVWHMNVGMKYQGKRIIGFFRWVNISNPTNNSGWCDMVEAIIA